MTSNNISSFLPFILILLSCKVFSQADLLILEAPLDSSLNISDHLYIYKDSTKQLSINEAIAYNAQNKFSPLVNHRWQPRFKRDKYHLWYYIGIQNKTDHEIKLLYKPQWSNVQDFYAVHALETRKLSSSLHKAQESYDHFNEKGMILVSIPPNEKVRLFNKKESVDLRTENYLFEPSFYYGSKSKKLFPQYILKGVIIGGFLILILLFFSQYIFNRDTGYLFFAICILCLTVHQIREFGVFERNLFILPEELLDFKYYLPLTLLTYISHLIFVSVFLNAKKEIPLLYKFVKYCLILMFIWFVVDRIILSVDPYLAWQLMTYLRVVYVVCSLMVIFLVFKSSNTLSKFVLSGSGIYATALLAIIVLSYMENNSSLAGMDLSSIIGFVGLFGWLISYAIGLGYKSKLNLIEKTKVEDELRNSKFESEALKNADEIKTNFFNQISHDFRTPIAIIKTSTDKITGQPRVKEIIDRNSDNLLSLVDQILELNIAGRADTPINYKQIDITKHLRRSLSPFINIADQHKKSFKLYLDMDELWLDIDIKYLDRILYNLINNAFKFTNPRDEIRIDVSRTNNDLNIIVQDTGEGIAKKELPQIFDIYHSKSSHNHSGHGIGLATVKQLIKKIGGTIRCTSQIGEGTRFNIVIPISNKAQKVANTQIFHMSEIDHHHGYIAPRSVPPIAAEQPSILIAEDNLDLNNLLIEILSQDYNVIPAYNGEEAYRKVKEYMPDIILSDVMMPKMDGLQLCQKVKKHKMLDHIPFVFLTAKAGQDNIKEGLKKGALGYITKPFDKEEIIIRLNNILHTKEQLQSKYKNRIGISDHVEQVSDSQILFLHRTQSYIIENMSKGKINVGKLVKLHGTNHVSLNKKLKDLTGFTTAEYIRKVRLYNAYEMLTTSKLSVSDIAYAIGAKDPSHFSKIFKAEFHTSPSKLRIKVFT